MCACAHARGLCLCITELLPEFTQPTIVCDAKKVEIIWVEKIRQNEKSCDILCFKIRENVAVFR